MLKQLAAMGIGAALILAPVAVFAQTATPTPTSTAAPMAKKVVHHKAKHVVKKPVVKHHMVKKPMAKKPMPMPRVQTRMMESSLPCEAASPAAMARATEIPGSTRARLRRQMVD